MNAPSRVPDQLRLAAGICLRHLAMPLASTACLTAYVFGSQPALGTPSEAALAVPGILLLFGLPAAQRLWFLSAARGEPMSIVEASKASAPFIARLIRLVCLLAIPVFPIFLLAGALGHVFPRVGSGFFVIPVLAVDVSLTFVLPALILSTWSAVAAIRVGFLVSRDAWPASASYVLVAPLALQAFAAVLPTSALAGVASFAVVSVASLIIKGATLFFYLDRLPHISFSPELMAHLGAMTPGPSASR